MRSGRAVAVGAALAVVLGVASCGGGGSAAPASSTRPSRPTTSTTTTTRPTTTTTKPPPTAAELQAALSQFAARYGTEVNLSPVVPVKGGHIAVVTYNVTGQGSVPHAVVLANGGSGWVPASDLALEAGGQVQARGTSVTQARITGRGNDFAVTVSYNAGLATAVLTNTGGHWHFLTFRGGRGQPGLEVIDATIEGTSITQSANDCTPTCAEGQTVKTTFRYDPSSGDMVADPPSDPPTTTAPPTTAPPTAPQFFRDPTELVDAFASAWTSGDRGKLASLPIDPGVAGSLPAPPATGKAWMTDCPGMGTCTLQVGEDSPDHFLTLASYEVGVDVNDAEAYSITSFTPLG